MEAESQGVTAHLMIADECQRTFEDVYGELNQLIRLARKMGLKQPLFVAMVVTEDVAIRLFRCAATEWDRDEMNLVAAPLELTLANLSSRIPTSCVRCQKKCEHNSHLTH